LTGCAHRRVRAEDFERRYDARFDFRHPLPVLGEIEKGRPIVSAGVCGMFAAGSRVATVLWGLQLTHAGHSGRPRNQRLVSLSGSAEMSNVRHLNAVLRRN
jgi:hypothetical protein